MLILQKGWAKVGAVFCSRQDAFASFLLRRAGLFCFRLLPGGAAVTGCAAEWEQGFFQISVTSIISSPDFKEIIIENLVEIKERIIWKLLALGYETIYKLGRNWRNLLSKKSSAHILEELPRKYMTFLIKKKYLKETCYSCHAPDHALMHVSRHKHALWMLWNISHSPDLV